MVKILFIGDILGKGGRRATREILPMWKEKYKPDVIIANVENLAHGKGITIATMENILDLDIDAFTSGNHVFDKYELSKICFEKFPQIIRPANYKTLKFKNDTESKPVPGHGYFRFSKKNQQFLILNFSGTVFMEKQYPGEIDNPFSITDALLLQEAQKGDIIIVDLHAEATSEKVAFGYYLDGRVSAVLGTHTHIPTADARVLPGGTAYITDVGMTGPVNSVLGTKKDNVLKKFLNPESKFKNEIDEEGVMMVNGVLMEIGDDQKAIKIEKLYQEV